MKLNKYLNKYRLIVNPVTVGEGWLHSISYIVQQYMFVGLPKLFDWKAIDIFDTRKAAEDYIKENSKRKFDILIK